MNFGTEPKVLFVKMRTPRDPGRGDGSDPDGVAHNKSP